MANQPTSPWERAAEQERTDSTAAGTFGAATSAGTGEAGASTAGQTRDDGSFSQRLAGFADYGRKAADQIEQLSKRFDRKDFDKVVADVERFARQRPALFVGAAFAAGMLVGGWVRASSARVRRRDASRARAAWEAERASSGVSSSFS